MDTQIVEVRKNVIIPFTIALNQSSYTYNINTVEFIPDEVNVKYINYSSAVPELGSVTLVYTDLVSDYIASFIGNNIQIQPNCTFTLRKPIKGNYRFDIQDVTGTPEIARAGEFAMHLEFIKYKTDKPTKVY